MNSLWEVLCVDDQGSVLEFLDRNLREAGYKVTACKTWASAKSCIDSRRSTPDLILVDPISFNGNGVPLEEICKEAGDTPVIVLSSSHKPETAVMATKCGAWAYLCKPISGEKLCQVVGDVIKNASERPKSNKKPVKSPLLAESEFLFKSRAMQEVERMSSRVASSDVPVLITGETGVGKDVIARYIHRSSNHSNRPYVKVNCAAMPTELVESELFGYRKGAFTGAYIDRPGKFEFANHGTIFLDEIAELSSAVQAKLLQVLQDGQFSPLGSNQEVQVSVRVIAATNRKLEEAIKQGKFREDLYYRLNVININVCPLRHRKEEIPEFCKFFMNKFAFQYGSEIEAIPKDLLGVFMRYDWPGNVRELENLVKRFAVLQDGPSIANELAERISGEASVNGMTSDYVNQVNHNQDEIDLREVTKKAVSEVEKSIIASTLVKTRWNKSKAARHLKISYKTLLSKIDIYGLEPKD